MSFKQRIEKLEESKLFMGLFTVFLYSAIIVIAFIYDMLMRWWLFKEGLGRLIFS